MPAREVEMKMKKKMAYSAGTNDNVRDEASQSGVHGGLGHSLYNGQALSPAI